MNHLLAMMRRQAYALAVALDLLGSACSGGDSWQTLSARLGKARREGSRFWSPVADALDGIVLLVFRVPGHCDASLAAYEARMRAVG